VVSPGANSYAPIPAPAPAPIPAPATPHEIAYTTIVPLFLWDRFQAYSILTIPRGGAVKARSNEKCSWDANLLTYWCPVYYGTTPGRIDTRYVMDARGEIVNDVLICAVENQNGRPCQKPS
jgi:hypothetical protein